MCMNCNKGKSTPKSMGMPKKTTTAPRVGSKNFGVRKTTKKRY